MALKYQLSGSPGRSVRVQRPFLSAAFRRVPHGVNRCLLFSKILRPQRCSSAHFDSTGFGDSSSSAASTPPSPPPPAVKISDGATDGPHSCRSFHATRIYTAVVHFMQFIPPFIPCHSDQLCGSIRSAPPQL